VAGQTEPIVRQARAADIEALARMRWDFTNEDGRARVHTFDEFARSFREFAERALAGAWMIWVAEDEGRIICTLYLQIIDKVPRPGLLEGVFGYVTNVYTVPEYRGRGVGARLLDVAVAWARERGLEFLVLWPSATSVPFYERSGFVRSPTALELNLEE
jgi:GNAT superfamily N-acetyltransferase